MTFRSFLISTLLMLPLASFAIDKPLEKTGTETNTALTHVKLETSMGDIVIELFPAKAPKTVENFVQYVNDGFYNGTIFHRVINNFMIQGGGFNEQILKKTTRAPIQNEADNGLSNKVITVAMARTRAPHSASAQFFINVKDNIFLDHRNRTLSGWGYTVFGRVVSGMDVVHTIKAVPTGAKGMFPKDAPLENVVIKTATMVAAP